MPGTVPAGGGTNVLETSLGRNTQTYSPRNCFACVVLLPTWVGVVGATYLSSLFIMAAYLSGTTTLERITLLVILSLMRKAGCTTWKHCNVVRVCILLRSQATEKSPCWTAASKIMSSKSNVFFSSLKNLTRSMLCFFIHFVWNEVPLKSILWVLAVVYMVYLRHGYIFKKWSTIDGDTDTRVFFVY